MKKRILSMMLILTMVMGIFTGCGAGGSKEITVSEMLDSILEENGEVVMYTYWKDGDDWTEDYSPSKNTEMVVEYYDGKTLTAMYSEDAKLGGYLDGTSEINIPLTSAHAQNADCYLRAVTDSSNGDTLYMSIYCDGVYPTKNDYYDGVEFGEFSRKEINGVSCMVFATYKFYVTTYDGIEQRVSSVSYTIIPDTEFTQDKTVVLDSADTEGIKVEKDDSKVRNGRMYITTQDRNWTFSE